MSSDLDKELSDLRSDSKLLLHRVKMLESSIAELKGDQKKMTWIVIVAIAGAFFQWVVKGGLSGAV